MEEIVLGGRYELVEKIGSGGMAIVFKARCRLLNRYVAIKILKPEFTHDEEFVKRFRIEAQSAASLSHPNIVSIYDVGQEDDIHYIVMEYVEGITLKKYIAQAGKLWWEEAVHIAVQICSALEQAHRKKIIHRDIKPHNILITPEGIAKVTDFGIAKAVTSSTITVAGGTMGSVHYFSPEQARGGYIDEKSDLYSLGIVMYEMVTGKMPFDGESPISVALKHIQAEAKQPIELDNSIPYSVNNIIVKAIKKDQKARYQTASKMLADLNRALREPYGDFVELYEYDDDGPTLRMEGLGSEGAFPEREVQMGKGKNGKGKGKKKERITALTAVLTAVVIIGIFVIIGYQVVVGNIMQLGGDSFKVSDYVGMNINEVKPMLEEKNITVIEKRVFNEEIEKDIIIEQNVPEGFEFKLKGSDVIEFTVSEGPQLVKIPDLKNTDYRKAEADLKLLGLDPEVVDEYSETVGSGMVIRTEPESGREVDAGSSVRIIKSVGPKLSMVEVPNLIGKTREEAQALLAEAKLSIGKIYPEEEVSSVSRIVEQYPLPMEKVEEESPVDLYFEETQEQTDNEPGRVYETYSIVLTNPENYGDKVKVVVEITPSDTNEVTTIMNEYWNKNSFPVPVQIPVPKNGSTRVKILLDNEFYKELYKVNG